MLAKLSELMFVEAMRRYVETLPPDGRGGSPACAIRRSAARWRLLHGEPAKAWTVDELGARGRAFTLGAGRALCGARRRVSDPVPDALALWRSRRSALRSGSDAIARVAEHSGYESEAAFSRAFKREFGMPPATWRKAGQTRQPA